MQIVIDIPEEEYKCLDYYQAINQPIFKAIKNGILLDKIRAEIEQIEEGISSYHNDRPWIFKDEVLQIIDKYTGVSE